MTLSEILIPHKSAIFKAFDDGYLYSEIASCLPKFLGLSIYICPCCLAKFVEENF